MDVTMREADLPPVPAAGLLQRFRQPQPDFVPVLLREQVHAGPADDFLMGVAQDREHRMVAVRQPQSGVHLPDPVAAGFHDGAKALLACAQGALGALERSAFPTDSKRPIHRRGQPAQIVLQHVVQRAALQGLDGEFLADGSGHEEERHVRRLLACNQQRILAAEPGHREVAENDVGRERGQCPAQLHLVADADVFDRQRQVAQRPQDEFGIRWRVLDQQDIEGGSVHAHGALHR
jgi:hypothetical protein